jgi:hypothetical protein
VKERPKSPFLMPVSSDYGASAFTEKEREMQRIPDPSYLEPMPFPLKGSITTHAVCGADISTQPSQATSTFEVLEAIAKQVEAIWQAQQEKDTRKHSEGGSK